jgi:hypothetical protein
VITVTQHLNALLLLLHQHQPYYRDSLLEAPSNSRIQDSCRRGNQRYIRVNVSPSVPASKRKSRNMAQQKQQRTKPLRTKTKIKVNKKKKTNKQNKRGKCNKK